MKKVLLIAAILLLVLTCFIACTGPADTTGSDVTTTEAKAEDTPNVTTGNNGQVIPGELAEGQDYIAVENTAKWEKDPVDTSAYSFFGTGVTAIQECDRELGSYAKTYYLDNGTGREEIKRTEVRKLKMIGIKVENKNDSAKTVDLIVSELNARVQTSWTSVTARAGSYLMFEFTSNMPIGFCTTVTATEGGSQATAFYTQKDITVSGSDGTYTGVAKCTVPYSPGKTFYINICADSTGYPVIASIPVEIKTAKYDTEFSLIFQGDWELIRDKEYLPNLIDLFYNVYPRLYARWGVGTEPKQITFVADKSYDGVAYCAGTEVVVAVDYANSNPQDIGFFSHEITHSIQQYGGHLNYGEGSVYQGVKYDAWWTENMASYGGFRYFHWGYSTKFVQFYDATKFINWGDTYAGYGDGCQVFLSYLDWKFPTTDKNGDGKITDDEYGVIDAINFTIKSSDVMIYDNPVDPRTPFNQAVARATGGKYESLDAIRAVYKEDIQSGAFRCIGFGDYKDNFLTENVQGVPNPTYPKWENVTPGDKTATALANPVTTGNNILTGATILEYSSHISKNPITNVIDGDLTKNSMWQSQSTGAAKDYKYQLMGISHSFVIDLGSVKSFDTYTVVNRGYISDVKTHNTNEWEILISDDGKTWTSVDYQVYKEGTTRVNGPDIVSFNIGDVSARYIEFRIYTTDKGNTGTARLVEFMVFDN